MKCQFDSLTTHLVFMKNRAFLNITWPQITFKFTRICVSYSYCCSFKQKIKDSKFCVSQFYMTYMFHCKKDKKKTEESLQAYIQQVVFITFQHTKGKPIKQNRMYIRVSMRKKLVIVLSLMRGGKIYLARQLDSQDHMRIHLAFKLSLCVHTKSGAASQRPRRDCWRLWMWF